MVLHSRICFFSLFLSISFLRVLPRFCAFKSSRKKTIAMLFAPEVVNDCKLGEKKNVNVPGVKVEIPVVGEREIKDIEEWAVPNNADYIALSRPEKVKVLGCHGFAGACKTLKYYSTRRFIFWFLCSQL